MPRGIKKNAPPKAPAVGLQNIKTRTRKPAVKKDKTIAPAHLALHLRDLAAKEFKDTSIKTVDEWIDSIYGVSLCGNLPLQYLMKIDVFPLERTFSLSGEQGTAKTSLLWYLIKRFAGQEGQGVYLDAEKKVNPDQAMAILQSRELMANVLPLPVNSLEDMFKAIRLFSKQYNEGAISKDVPMFIGVDSLGYLTKQEELDASGEDTQKGYQGMHNASYIKQQLLEILQNYIPNNPIAIMFLNHQTAKPPAQGSFKPAFVPVEHNEPGGRFKEYSYSVKLEMFKGGVVKTVTEGTTPTYRIKVVKNALGAAEKSPIVVPYRTVFREDTRDELIDFDWDYALVELLAEKVSKERLHDVMDLSLPSKSRCSSKTVGASDVSWSEMGAMIHANEKICADLASHVLNIKHKRIIGSGKKTKEIPDGKNPD